MRAWWTGLYALVVRSATPKPIVEKLSAVFEQVINPAWRSIEDQRLSPYKGSIETFPRRWRRNQGKAEETKRLGIVVQ